MTCPPLWNESQGGSIEAHPKSTGGLNSQTGVLPDARNAVGLLPSACKNGMWKDIFLRPRMTKMSVMGWVHFWRMPVIKLLAVGDMTMSGWKPTISLIYPSIHPVIKLTSVPKQFLGLLQMFSHVPHLAFTATGMKKIDTGGKSELSTKQYIFVVADDVNHEHKWLDVLTLKGTRKLHAICNTLREGYKVSIRNLSCFCEGCEGQGTCINKEYVSSWEKKALTVTSCTLYKFYCPASAAKAIHKNFTKIFLIFLEST